MTGPNAVRFSDSIMLQCKMHVNFGEGVAWRARNVCLNWIGQPWTHSLEQTSPPMIASEGFFSTRTAVKYLCLIEAALHTEKAKSHITLLIWSLELYKYIFKMHNRNHWKVSLED